MADVLVDDVASYSMGEDDWDEGAPVRAKASMTPNEHEAPLQIIHCHRCGTPTKHLPDEDGAFWCMRCLKAGVHERPEQRQESPTTPTGGGVVMGTIKTAGFFASLLFLLVLGTCGYFCVSVAGSGHH